MLSISKPLSASQAQTYHKREFTAADQSYYRQGGAVEGEWQGKLADTFGLAGTSVDARHFALLTEGKNPQTEEQIIRSKPSKEYAKANGETVKPVEHRAGWDATFSAPKSVSLAALVGGDERVREAHRESVTAALTELERYTQARIGGNNPAETTGRFIAAKFEHDTARPVDGYAAPQLHTHAVVFNMTQRDDGRMRALQSKSFYDSRSYLTAVYQSELTVRLRNLGYDLTAGKSGAPEIKGFTQEYLDASSLRSQQIREQMEKNGFQGPAAAQIAALETRDSKQLLSPEEVLAAHRQIAAEHGNQAQKVVAEARERSGSIRARSAAVATPSFTSFLTDAPPMPHTSSAGTVQSSAARASAARRSHTPAYSERFLANQFASFASVFVGPMPTHPGPGRCFIGRPRATASPGARGRWATTAPVAPPSPAQAPLR